nr:MAG TPA: hypothetical protein [Caudoviricetes sp.]
MNTPIHHRNPPVPSSSCAKKIYLWGVMFFYPQNH